MERWVTRYGHVRYKNALLTKGVLQPRFVNRMGAFKARKPLPKGVRGTFYLYNCDAYGFMGFSTRYCPKCGLEGG